MMVTLGAQRMLTPTLVLIPVALLLIPICCSAADFPPLLLSSSFQSHPASPKVTSQAYARWMGKRSTITVRAPEDGGQQKRQEHTKQEQPQQREEVIWLEFCSPRYPQFRKRSFVQLGCEAVAPTGTRFSWYKDNRPLTTNEPEPIREEYEENDERRWKMENYFGTYGLRFSTKVYIDCGSAGHEGEYRLEVITPTDKVFNRYFNLSLIDEASHTGMGHRSNLCSLLPFISYFPRIYQFARWAIAKRNEVLVLPCRVQGKDFQHSWTFKGDGMETTLTSSVNFFMKSNGDLVIRQVQQQGRYTCHVESLLYPSLNDTISTDVYIQ